MRTSSIATVSLSLLMLGRSCTEAVYLPLSQHAHSEKQARGIITTMLPALETRAEYHEQPGAKYGEIVPRKGGKGPGAAAGDAALSTHHIGALLVWQVTLLTLGGAFFVALGVLIVKHGVKNGWFNFSFGRSSRNSDSANELNEMEHGTAVIGHPSERVTPGQQLPNGAQELFIDYPGRAQMVRREVSPAQEAEKYPYVTIATEIPSNRGCSKRSSEARTFAIRSRQPLQY